MSDWYPAFWAELKALIQTTWPEITNAKFYTGAQALRQNILETSPPIAAVLVGQVTPETDFAPCAMSLYRAPVSVYYLAAIEGGRDNQAYVWGKCKTLADSVEKISAVFTTFQVVDRASIDASESNPVNIALLDSQTPMVAASCSWEPGLLVGEDVFPA